MSESEIWAMFAASAMSGSIKLTWKCPEDFIDVLATELAAQQADALLQEWRKRYPQ